MCLLNYKKNGDMFWNQFFVAALRDKFGQIVNYVGVQVQSVRSYCSSCCSSTTWACRCRNSRPLEPVELLEPLQP